MKNKGFTLIELLVLIAIIGILASVIIQSMLTAKEKAKDTPKYNNCLTTCKDRCETYLSNRN